MKQLRRTVLAFCLLILLVPAVAVSAQVPMPPGGDQPAAPEGEWAFLRLGIEYQKFHLTNPRPIDIFVARMYRSTETATVDTAIGQGTIAAGTETVPGMYARYNGAVNYWGQKWGGRNDVAVAINGYFFNINTGVPWSGVVHSGSYDRRFYDDNLDKDVTSDAGFAWTLDRQAFIGACTYHTGNKNEVLFERAGTYAPNVDAINFPRDNESVILYTAQYDTDTGTGSGTLELMIELSSPNLIIPKSAGNVGYISRISSQGSSPLYFDYVVLSFWGAARDALQDRIDNGSVAVGDQVTIYQEITDCPESKTGSHDWTKTYASLGGDYHFLINGVYYDPGTGDSGAKNSRTAIAYNNDFIYFVVVDGWNKNVSEGITILELNNFLVGQLQATNAVTMDSGGSSTFAVNGAIVNNTYCNFTRNCGISASELNALPTEPVSGPDTGMPESTPQQNQDILVPLQPDCVPGDCKPLVATAFLMLSSEPISQSLTFTPTQPVSATASTAIRLGPGSNYASLGTVPAGETGKVIGNISQTNGVLAKNGGGFSYWWFVDMGDLTGWVPEETLAGGSTPPEPPPVAYTDFLFMPTIPRAAVGVAAAEYGKPQVASEPLFIPGPTSR